MALKLREVQDDNEFPELFEVFRKGFTDPGTKLWPLFSGDRGREKTADLAAVMSEWTSRAISWHRADPTSHWLKVVDDQTGAILGGGRWSVYESNPYDHAERVEPGWWPEGAPRKVAAECLNQFLATSAQHMNKPHAFLNILFTHPAHRRKGVAALIIKWGLHEAHRRGLDSYIEATIDGKPVYEKFGFEVIDSSQWHLDPAQLSQEEAQVALELLPFEWWSMHKGT